MTKHYDERDIYEKISGKFTSRKLKRFRSIFSWHLNKVKASDEDANYSYIDMNAGCGIYRLNNQFLKGSPIISLEEAKKVFNVNKFNATFIESGVAVKTVNIFDELKKNMLYFDEITKNEMQYHLVNKDSEKYLYCGSRKFYFMRLF